MTEYPGHKTPIGISVMVILSILSGGFTIIIALILILLFQNNLFIVVLTSIMFIDGVSLIIAGFGLFKRKKWAWILSLILIGFSFIINIINIVGDGYLNTIQIIIEAIIIYYLFTPRIREYYGVKANRI